MKVVRGRGFGKEGVAVAGDEWRKKTKITQETQSAQRSAERKGTVTGDS
jgi:hypothetical protein